MRDASSGVQAVPVGTVKVRALPAPSASRRSIPSFSRGRKEAPGALRGHRPIAPAGRSVGFAAGDRTPTPREMTSSGQTLFPQNQARAMSKSTTLVLSVQPKLLQSAGRVLQQVDMNTSDAVTLFLQQVVRQRRTAVRCGRRERQGGASPAPGGDSTEVVTTEKAAELGGGAVAGDAVLAKG